MALVIENGLTIEHGSKKVDVLDGIYTYTEIAKGVEVYVLSSEYETEQDINYVIHGKTISHEKIKKELVEKYPEEVQAFKDDYYTFSESEIDTSEFDIEFEIALIKYLLIYQI